MWRIDRTYEMVGVRVRVRSEAAELGPRLDRTHGMFPQVATVESDPTVDITEGAGGALTVVYGDRTFDEATLDGALMRTLQMLNSAVIRRTPERLFAVHAAVVTIGERVVALPGRARTGKTTLTAAFLLAGAGYVTDEAMLVDRASGDVVPYPKALWLDNGSRPLLGLEDDRFPFRADDFRSPLTADDLGAQSVSEPVTVTDIVGFERGEDAAIDEARPAEGVTMLLEAAFNREVRSEHNFRFAAKIASSARVWRLTYEAPREGALRVIEWLG